MPGLRAAYDQMCPYKRFGFSPIQADASYQTDTATTCPRNPTASIHPPIFTREVARRKLRSCCRSKPVNTGTLPPERLAWIVASIADRCVRTIPSAGSRAYARTSDPTRPSAALPIDTQSAGVRLSIVFLPSASRLRPPTAYRGLGSSDRLDHVGLTIGRPRCFQRDLDSRGSTANTWYGRWVTSSQILDRLHELQRARFAWDEPDSVPSAELEGHRRLWNSVVADDPTGTVREVLERRISECQSELHAALAHESNAREYP